MQGKGGCVKPASCHLTGCSADALLLLMFYYHSITYLEYSCLYLVFVLGVVLFLSLLYVFFNCLFFLCLEINKRMSCVLNGR